MHFLFSRAIYAMLKHCSATLRTLMSQLMHSLHPRAPAENLVDIPPHTQPTLALPCIPSCGNFMSHDFLREYTTEAHNAYGKSRFSSLHLIGRELHCLLGLQAQSHRQRRREEREREESELRRILQSKGHKLCDPSSKARPLNIQCNRHSLGGARLQAPNKPLAVRCAARPHF